jgi:hypothetical protein
LANSSLKALNSGSKSCEDVELFPALLYWSYKIIRGKFGVIRIGTDRPPKIVAVWLVSAGLYGGRNAKFEVFLLPACPSAGGSSVTPSSAKKMNVAATQYIWAVIFLLARLIIWGILLKVFS